MGARRGRAPLRRPRSSGRGRRRARRPPPRRGRAARRTRDRASIVPALRSSGACRTRRSPLVSSAARSARACLRQRARSASIARGGVCTCSQRRPASSCAASTRAVGQASRCRFRPRRSRILGHGSPACGATLLRGGDLVVNTRLLRTRSGASQPTTQRGERRVAGALARAVVSALGHELRRIRPGNRTQSHAVRAEDGRRRSRPGTLPPLDDAVCAAQRRKRRADDLEAPPNPAAAPAAVPARSARSTSSSARRA